MDTGILPVRRLLKYTHMQPTFIHLRLHTEYSLSDGLIRIEELVEAAAKMNMPAIAVTDQVNFFAAVKFYQEAIAAGVKPILGADCWLENPQNEKQPFRVTFLCQNETGYKNLIQLISHAYIEGQKTDTPILQRAWLENANAGLIVLSGGRQGDIGQYLLADKESIAIELLKQWSTLFSGRFYLELQRTGRPQEEEYIAKVVLLAQRFNIPVVATNDARFLSRDDFEAHEARVCIHDGYVLNDPKRPRNYSEQQYLRTPQEMQRLFADIPSALTNTVEIAKRCNVELLLGKSFLPNFPIPAGMTTESYLTQQAEEGLKQRLAAIHNSSSRTGIVRDPGNMDVKFDNESGLTSLSLDPGHSMARTTEKKAESQLSCRDDDSKYWDRLKIELNVINSMGFAGYFLIVADFIRWAKENGIPVGPGRGSGAGSLVAYALQITDLDPLQYDLLFERFLNPERISMPDFDIDFCMEGRDRVIDYVSERYGRDAVSQIITYGSMAAKAVVRDVGRVLGHPYGMVDKLAKLIPFELGITLEKALAQEEELKRRYQQEDEVRVLIDLALKLEGLARNAGKHAGGVVIAPSKLIDFAPLYCEAGDTSHCVTQYDKDDIEKVGLVKFDFLGLRTLTIIDWAVKTINEKNNILLDITKIPLDDPKTFALLKACKSTAVFQFESRGMKDLIKRLQPDEFEELIALGALFRPGPLQSGMVDDFINRKHGRAQVDYPHPALEPILRPTYGIVVYQEQVLQIAQVLAGYTLGGADLLRRAMGKKKPEEMAKQRAIFIEGSKKNGVAEKVAAHIFDLMEKFAGYGFNKSHAAAYALVSYQTAWLKAHYPSEFMAAVLSSDMDHTDKVVSFLEECRLLKLTVLPPDVNRSQYKFTVNDQSEIVYGLGAVKGAGEAAIELIVEERTKQGPYKDLFDFCHRIDTRKVNRRVLEALIYSGSFDSLGINRASLMASLEVALQTAEQHSEAHDSGQHDMFGMAAVPQQPKAVDVVEWTAEKRLQGEKEVLGFYLTGHPLQKYEMELSQFVTGKLAQINHNQNQSVTIAGWVVAVRTLFTKRGDRMAVVMLEDQTGRLELTVFSDVYTEYRELLTKDRLLIVEGEVSLDEFTGNSRVLAKKILDITQAREKHARCVVLKLTENITPIFIDQLRQAITPYRPGSCPILVEYNRSDSQAQLALGPEWRVKPSDELLKAAQQLLGKDAVQMQYRTL